MNNPKSNINSNNEWADHWHYKIGINILPLDIGKTTYEDWSKYQLEAIPDGIHEEWKRKGRYKKGMVLMPGKVCRGENKRLYFVGIDFDIELGFKEFCNIFGVNTSIEELRQKFIIEQHAKDPNSFHLYFYSEIPFTDKSPDYILGIEIKSNGKGLMCATPSYHTETDSIWQIKGTDSPIILKSEDVLKLMSDVNDICKKYNVIYLKNEKDTSSAVFLTPLIRQMINSLEINPQIIIQQGTRHHTLLSIACALLFKYKYNNNVTTDTLKKFFIDVNKRLCSPSPLPESEMETIWSDAVKYSEEKITEIKIINTDVDDPNNYNKPIVVPLQIGKQLLKEDIVQNFVKDNQQNSLILEFNHKYPQTKIHIPIFRPEKWLDFRKSVRKILEEYKVTEDHISLILKTVDGNYDLIINKSRDGNTDRSIGTIADILVKLARKNSTLFKDEFNIPYGLVKINNHFEVMSVKGSNFEIYLSKLYYDNCDKKIANAESISNSKRILTSIAIFEGKTISLHLRVAWNNHESKDSIYYDLTDDKRRCIKITKGSGWTILENQTDILFKRYGHQLPQLEPSHNYDPKILDKFVDSLNISNEKDKILVKVWIISLLIPEIPIPMLLPFGAEGSAKSTLQRKIKLVIDPSSLDLVSIYNDKTQFIQQLTHNFLCFYDNLRYAPGWLSDEVCRAITGGAFTKRGLYTDDEDIPYRYKKRMSFSGINVIFKEADALDRSIRIELERLDPKEKIPEDQIDYELKQQIPQLLGDILDVVSKAIEIKGSINPSELPRMADFAVWGEAIARTLGYKPLEFLDAYFENIGKQKIDIIESDPFTEALSKFIDYDTQSWISQLSVFIQNLKAFADTNNIDSSKFPKNAQSISNRLRKGKTPLLEGLGIEIIVERITSGIGNNKKLKNTAIVKIRKRPPLSPLSPLIKNDDGNGGDDSSEDA